MIAVFVAALALAGAPAGSTIGCDPAMVESVHALGLAFASTGQAWVGKDSCAAALTAGMSPAEYRRTGRLSQVVLGWRTGRGLLVVLHEARHLAGVANECLAEQFAIRNVGTMIDRFVPKADRAVALRSALTLHALLPANYRGC